MNDHVHSLWAVFQQEDEALAGNVDLQQDASGLLVNLHDRVGVGDKRMGQDVSASTLFLNHTDSPPTCFLFYRVDGSLLPGESGRFNLGNPSMPGTGFTGRAGNVIPGVGSNCRWGTCFSMNCRAIGEASSI